jgi:hypothetical protein
MGKGEQMSRETLNLDTFINKQVHDLRDSADRCELLNQPVSAVFFRNDAYWLEHEAEQNDKKTTQKEKQ